MSRIDVAAPAVVPKPRDDEIDVFGLTHRGHVRSENQDHFLIASLKKRLEVQATSLPSLDIDAADSNRLALLAMVADGVGGGVGGEAASRFTLRAIAQYVAECSHCFYTATEADDAHLSQALQDAALRVHDALQREAEGDQRATTLTLFMGVWPRVYLLQLGDSRYYLWRQGKLTQISRDQTLAQELLDAGVLRPDTLERSRLAHVLSSAVGGPNSRPEVTALNNDWECVHLLCSDGLTKHVSDARIAWHLEHMTSSRQACEDLLAEALAGGGTDNVTIIVGRAVRRSS